MPPAWTSLHDVTKWHSRKGPKANEDVRALTSALAGLPGPNAYAQPGPCIPWSRHCSTRDRAPVKKPLEDFMSQVTHDKEPGGREDA
ncbi:hypothetical protein [Streptomyces sp. LS1784]|uniref:hypothetical protein n=1 Tax=Streptomyces sp. LS1784 TaxID=2851533 RepID=UPI001CC9CD93|nr:hypothetical protein [Streptomyces sp. LS1784]